MILCAAPSYLAAAPQLASMEDLPEHSCLRFRNAASGRVFPWWVESRGIKVPTTVVFDDGPAIRRACELGAGLAMMPSWLCRESLREGKVVEVLPEQPRPFLTPVWLLYLNRRFLPGRTRLLLDFLAEKREHLEVRLAR